MKVKSPTSTASSSHPAIAAEMVETAAGEADVLAAEAAVVAIAVVAADTAVAMAVTAEAVGEGASLIGPRFNGLYGRENIAAVFIPARRVRSARSPEVLDHSPWTNNCVARGQF